MANNKKKLFPRILVLGNDSRATLAVVRSLGRKGLRVTAGLDEQRSIIPYSRYVQKTIEFPSLSADLPGWEKKLKEVVTDNSFDMVIPVSESALVPIMLKHQEFETLARFAVPDSFGFENTYFKQKTLALATKLGIPTPRSVLIEKIGDLPSWENSGLPFPLIVKPITPKVWPEGYKMELGAKLVRNKLELENEAQEFLQYTPILLQEYIPGVGVGQEFLCRNGEIIMAFQHERVHEPLGSGGSSLRKSAPLNEAMLDFSRRLLSHLRWTGVAMIEYKWNLTARKITLLEVNGRFWGSLPLALVCGVDFPFGLYQLLKEEKISPFGSYPKNIFCRNLMNDLKWKIYNSERSAFYKCFAVGWESIVALLRFMLRKEQWDTVTLDDPLPGLAEFWFELRNVSGKLAERTQKYFYRFYFNLFIRRIQKTRVQKLLKENPAIIFVCFGNISRSAFAEGYAKLKTTLYKVSSSGLYPIENRFSPFFARRAGRELGVDLKNHRSRKITAQFLNSAGVIFCMDRREYKSLRRKFPQFKNKLFFLGAFNKNAGDYEIADPWGKSPDVFRRSFRNIAASIDNLPR